MNHCKRERWTTRLAVSLFWSVVVGFLAGGGILLIAELIEAVSR